MLRRALNRLLLGTGSSPVAPSGTSTSSSGTLISPLSGMLSLAPSCSASQSSFCSSGSASSVSVSALAQASGKIASAFRVSLHTPPPALPRPSCGHSVSGARSRGFSSSSGPTPEPPGKSILSPGPRSTATPGATGSVLEGAAEQRLSRIKAAHDAETATAGLHDAPPSVLGHVLSFIGRTLMIGGTGIGLAAAYYTYRYDLAEVQTMVRETKAKQENAFVGSQLWVDAMETYIDTRASIEKQIKSFRDPTYDRLLPDMRPEMRAMGIKTLVLDLNDVLVSKQWTRQKGWTLYKRPGAQDFLFEMGQYFEVVIFTDEPSAYAIPVINKLDKNQVVPYRLYRPETQYHEGKHVRDLSKLNRDLSQVLFISADPDAYMFQPENTLKLKPWKDDPSDTTLFDLLPMLQMIALKGVKDVRDVVKSYDGEEDVAKAFKKRMQQVSASQKQSKPRGLLAFK